jgi:hypothetical protein
MIPLKDRLPPFKSLLSPEDRARLESLPPDQRRAFIRALALSALMRRPLGQATQP